jgi:hypothetical protein
MLVAVLDTACMESSNSNGEGRSYYKNHTLIENKVIPFLSAIEYPFLPRESEEMSKFVEDIADGNCDEIHQILLFCLDNQQECREKIYLASYLAHIDFPLDAQYSQQEEEILVEQIERYQQMQKEFKDLYTSHLDAKKRYGDIRGVVDDTNMEFVKNKKMQLLERMRELEETNLKHEEDATFFNMLRVAKLLKREKEEEIRLEECLSEQNDRLHLWEQKLKDLQESYTLNDLQNSSNESLCLQGILQHAQDEISKINILITSNLEPIRYDLEEKFQKLQLLSYRSQCTHQDLEYKLQEKRKLENSINDKMKVLHVEQAKVNYPKIDLYYQVSKSPFNVSDYIIVDIANISFSIPWSQSKT